MGRIPEAIIEQVREAHDVVDVVGRAVALKKAGTGYKGLCPFHDEKTPSFTVNPSRQTYKCFGCGKGGNVFTFLTETQGLTFPEAVRQLAEERGIQVPSAVRSDPQQDSRVERIRRALAFAQQFFVATLLGADGREARAYLARRGYDAEAVERFGLGYAPAAWDRLLAAARDAGVPPQDLDESGLVVPKREGAGYYDRFRHRVIFPIADPQGRLLTFAGRTLDPDENAKYLNGPETLVFKKADVLYALDRAREGIRRADEALLMEGYTDVLMCHLHGFDRAVAGMGTAFTERQARLLRRLAERVVLLYDGDQAGRMAAERALDVLLEQGLDVRVALLPADRDVDEVLLEDGPEALEAILAGARDLFEFKLEVLAARHDLDTPRGRARAAEDLVASVARVQSPVERDQLLRRIAERLGGGPETEAVLRAEAARLVRGAKGPAVRRAPARHGQAASRGGAAAANPGPDDLLERIRRESRARDETDLLAAVVLLPHCRDDLFRAVGPEEFADPARLRLYNAAFDLWEGGAPFDDRMLLARFQSDGEVAAVLAGLPDDATLEERVLSLVAFMERRRLQIHHQREVVRRIGGRGADDPGAAAGPDSLPEGARATLDPDDSYYGDGPFADDPPSPDDGTEVS